MANEKRLVNAEAIARKLKYAHCTDCNVVRQIQCSACWVNDVLELLEVDSVDAVEVPETGIGDLSDGYHTFNGLYHQRMILFAALVKAYKYRAWKSYRHEDGELCFGGGWFIVGIDTSEGSYTYHYESKYFHLFDCIELQVGKRWDGHTEEDVTRLLSLRGDAEPVVHGRWNMDEEMYAWNCSVCRSISLNGRRYSYCHNCGAKMDGERKDNV